MKKVWQRIICSSLVCALLVGAVPLPPRAVAVPPATVSLENANIEVVVSTQNGGFVVRTLEGDLLTKDDNNLDLLYRRDAFDTSFASFQVASEAGTKEYVFGNDYGYRGLASDLSVSQDSAGISAVWTVDDLIFTQLLQPIQNELSNEHGTVRISYTVENKSGDPIAVKARLLLDTALGEQDFAYYELAQGALAEESFICIEQETSLSEPDNYLPANFFAYDNYQNPTVAAYTIFDQSAAGVRPYRLAFGHWNNLASTVFDFVPDGGLTFTNPYNRRFLTADSALAIYYDLGSVAAGGSSVQAATYYGVDSKVRVKDSDRVGVTVTAPPGLALNPAGDAYLEPDSSSASGRFKVTTNITNLTKPTATLLGEVTVAVLVDDGLVPLDGGGNELDQPPTSLQPYTMVLGNLAVGAMQQLTWQLRADVLPSTSYRKLVFRAHDTSGPDKRLLAENLIGSATTYLLCPGAGGLPELTFTSLGPDVIYNQGTRKLYLTGSGFGEYLSDVWGYQLLAKQKGAALGATYLVPKSQIIYSQDKPGVLEVVLEEEMPPGEYELVFAFDPMSPFTGQELRPPALGFLVSQDPAFRNDSYGIIAVVKEQDRTGKPRYRIRSFGSERDYQAELAGQEVLLEFRGKFVVNSRDYWSKDVLACSAATAKSGDAITVNGALDLEHGNIQIYRSEHAPDGVMVELNGDIYTSNSRTSVWSGNASLTPLLDGDDYGLVKYDQRGARVTGKQPEKSISLVWPSGYGMLQTIGGFAVDFRYGQFGAMYLDNDCQERTGYIVSFGGKLDLSFLLPGGSKQAESLTADDESETSESEDSITVSPSEKAKADNAKHKVKPVGKINIEDVLFGNGRGYLGFNSQAELMLPKYVAPLPAMGGKLSINTIGGYQVGVLGKTKTKKFELEFELKVQNAPHSNVPVPDKLYFFMAGFEPGVNIDGAGAVWLTGIGGGIDKLYDTIFKSGVPPLTLLLSTSFDIVKVMSGRADLSLSLQGLMMKLGDVKLKNTDKVILRSGTFGVAWEPGFYLQLSAMAEILETIEGRAYLVVDGDFFEMFLRASVKVPKDVKVIGGMTVANTDLGANHDKIWGTVQALGVRLGVTYYWGGSVNFGSGNNASKPTYPELLGLDSVPVGVDAKTGETLYLSVGSNLSEGLPAELVASFLPDGLALLGLEPSLTSTLDRISHKLNLGGTREDVALAIRLAGAVADPTSVISITTPTGDPYALTVYTGSNPDVANTNPVVADDGQSTTVYVTITDYQAGDWQIGTSRAADIVLYTIGELPEATSLQATVVGDRVNVTWTGKGLHETEISCYLTSSIGDGTAEDPGELGRLLGSLGGMAADGSPRPKPEANGQSLTLDLPSDLPSGDYYLRLIVSKEDQVNQNLVATDAALRPLLVSYHNGQQPAAPADIALQNVGDGLFAVQVATPPTGLFAGYRVSLYEQTAAGVVPTGLLGLDFAKDASGALPPLLVGGSYLTTDGQPFGLLAGHTYLAEVAAYRVIDRGTLNPDDDLLIFSEPAYSAATALRRPTPPTVTFRPQAGTYQLVTKTVFTADGEQTITVPTFTQNDLQFTLQTDLPVSGYWSIDGALWLDPSDPGSGLTAVERVQEFSVRRRLCDGEHLLSFVGESALGDSFIFNQVFAVDTLPPRLMLTSPVNGSLFGRDGTLLLEGIGDQGSSYTILVDGVTKVKDQLLEPSAEGLISYTLQGLTPNVASHQITVIARDQVGHSVSLDALVNNAGLACIETVDILVDGLSLGSEPEQRNIDLSLMGRKLELSLVATLQDGTQVPITDERMVRWTAGAKVGSATVDAVGNLQISPGSIGYLLGELMVSEQASINSALTFGAEQYSGGRVNLVVSSTSGGTAKGGGTYLPGANVALTATPLPGYRFVGWVSAGGGVFSDAKAANSRFTMPDRSVVVTAHFLHSSQPDEDEQPAGGEQPGEPPNEPDAPEDGIQLTAGSLGQLRLPSEFTGNPNRIVAYYLAGARKVTVMVSRMIDGRIVFLAPQTATYYLAEDRTVYKDTVGHWARGPIDFVVARGLLGSVGGNAFNPEGKLTRAMFATVLARLDGADLGAYPPDNFSDVPIGSWYAGPVAWAAETGVTRGVGGGRFGPELPITREMLAAMLVNYLQTKGLTLPTVRDWQEPADSDQVHSWAKAAMQALYRAGIISGADNRLDPRRLTTRAECAAVMQRLISALLALAAAGEQR